MQCPKKKHRQIARRYLKLRKAQCQHNTRKINRSMKLQIIQSLEDSQHYDRSHTFEPISYQHRQSLFPFTCTITTDTKATSTTTTRYPDPLFGAVLNMPRYAK